MSNDQPALDELADEPGIEPVLRYSTFDTQDGPARQCQICGSTCWPGSTDPAWPAALEHGASCPVGESERLTAERDAARAWSAAWKERAKTHRHAADILLAAAEPSAADGEGER